MAFTITQNTHKYDRGETVISYINLQNSKAYQLISGNYWERSGILALANVLCFFFGGTNKSIHGDGNRKQIEMGLNWCPC